MFAQNKVVSNKKVPYTCKKKTYFFEWKNFLYFSQKTFFAKHLISDVSDRDFEYTHHLCVSKTASCSWFVWLCSEFASANKNLLLKRVCWHSHITLNYIIYLKKKVSKIFLLFVWKQLIFWVEKIFTCTA